jgi:hypothetical protein
MACANLFFTDREAKDTRTNRKLLAVVFVAVAGGAAELPIAVQAAGRRLDGAGPRPQTRGTERAGLAQRPWSALA